MDCRARAKSVISGRRLFKFLAKKRAWFESWRDPSDFSLKIKQVDRIIDAPFLFNNNAAKWVREGLVLTEYFRFERVSRVRLSGENFPQIDAYITQNGCDRSIQITEVLDRCRKRGLEYRWKYGCADFRWENGYKDGFNSEGIGKRAEDIAEALRKGIAKKAPKGYARSTVLLVYLNMSIRGYQRDRVADKISSALCEDFGFSGIVVLWNGIIFERSADGSVQWRCAMTSTTP
jgi:hypothetical protein